MKTAGITCIYLNGLWYKLSKLGVGGKMFNIVRNMYKRVNTCVQGCNTCSDFFECAVGLRQGEVMSPMLFAFFIEDLELFLQNKPECGLSIDLHFNVVCWWHSNVR